MATTQVPNWESNIEKWGDVNIEVYKFCFEQGQKRLTTLIEDGEKITNRSYALIGILIPLLSICVGNMINYIKKAEFGFGIVISLAGAGAFIISLVYLTKLIKSRAEFYAHVEPRSVFVKDQIEFAFNKEEHVMKSLYFHEIQYLQTKINSNRELNAKRIKWFDFCLLTMVITAVVLIAITFGFVIF
jgi:MFS-type transporter involved in bile tolerance (Atg22 family)